MRLLIISEFYLDDTNANGHCARMLVKGLTKSGVLCDLICVRESGTIDSTKNRSNGLNLERIFPVDNVDITLPKSSIKRITKRINRVSLIPNWPLESPNTAREIIGKAEKLICENSYDGVIAVHKTYLSVFCALQLQKNNSNLKVVLYLLDPIANEIDKHLGIRRFLFPKVKLEEKKAYERADCIINMRCNDSEPINIEYKDKIKYVDFPLLSNSAMEEKRTLMNNFRESEVIRLIYFGTLNKIYRSPDYLLDLLISLVEDENIEVYFYCQGDCVDDMIKRVSNHSDRIHISGFISQDLLSVEIAKSDIVMNIGNAMSNMVPSKIFDLLLYGKPIISVSKQKNDRSDSYIEKSGTSLIIKESDSLDLSIEKTKVFLKRFKQHDLKAICDIESIFKENTPDYSAEIIKSIFA